MKPTELADRLRKIQLYKVRPEALQHELVIANAEYAAHVADIEQRSAGLRRQLALGLTAAGAGTAVGAFKRVAAPSHETEWLILVSLLVAALVIIFYYIAKSRIQSEAIAEIRGIQIRASVLRDELARRQ
ncbi:hypothetical protein BE21_09455 [Sorangium cellulosum]|uniref:Transmembrane protein n=1 Tax=Sorangium cellulosum TaxID=56 RepID=A0A150U228_SORCE|nr:hypothetical protein BE21_09455 [Sorangium cellulosum]